MLPYSPINFFAVFSPTPGTPGILSTASPHKPSISITCIGSLISNLAQISFGPNISLGAPPLPGL